MERTSLIVIFTVVPIVLITAIVVSVVLIKKGNESFHENEREGIAIIDGYASDSTGSKVRFTVKVLESGYDNSFGLKGIYNMKKMNGELDERYPYFNIGDQVHVLYAPKKLGNLKYLEVRLNRDYYDYPE